VPYNYNEVAGLHKNKYDTPQVCELYDQFL